MSHRLGHDVENRVGVSERCLHGLRPDAVEPIRGDEDGNCTCHEPDCSFCAAGGKGRSMTDEGVPE